MWLGLHETWCTKHSLFSEQDLRLGLRSCTIMSLTSTWSFQFMGNIFLRSSTSMSLTGATMSNILIKMFFFFFAPLFHTMFGWMENKGKEGKRKRKIYRKRKKICAWMWRRIEGKVKKCILHFYFLKL